MVQLFAEGFKIELVLDEPPEAEWLAHQKERCEYYKRFEPNAELLNRFPICGESWTHMAMKGAESDLIWKCILSSNSEEVMAAINRIVEEKKDILLE
jgi:hypothetical protein